MIYKKLLFTGLLIFTYFIGVSQQSLNFELLHNWNGDDSPSPTFEYYNDVWGLTDCEGNEYAILGSAEFIYLFSLDPFEELGKIEVVGVGPHRDMKTYDEVLYICSDQGSEGLMIVDLRNLEAIADGTAAFEISNQLKDEFIRSHNIFIDQENSRLYTAGASISGTIVYDLFDDPLNPKLLAIADLPEAGGIHDIYVRDNIAYCSNGFNGYYIWDLQDPTEPILLAHTETNGFNHSSWLSEDGRYAFVAEEIPLGLPMLVIDLEHMREGEIEVVHSFNEPLLAPSQTNNVPHNPFVRGDHLYISYYQDGVQVYDITNPLDPVKVAYYDTNPDNVIYTGYSNNWGVYPFFESGKVLASDRTKGLFVLAPTFDFSPISYPTVSHLISLGAYNCDTKLFEFRAREGYLNYKVYESDTLYYDGPDHEFLVPAGEYRLFINNGDCSTRSANISSNTFFLSPRPDPEGEISPSESLEFCPGETTSINLSSNSQFNLWYRDGELINLNTNMFNLTISEPGEYWVEVFNHDPNGVGIPHVGDCMIESNHLTFSHYSVVVPEIIESDALLSTSQYESYQWFFNGEAIEDATDQFYQALENGDYHVQVVDANGCILRADPVTVVLTSTLQRFFDPSQRIYPNPVSNYLYLEADHLSELTALEVYSASGKLIRIIESHEIVKNRIEIDLSFLDSGLYFILGHEFSAQKFIKL